MPGVRSRSKLPFAVARPLTGTRWFPPSGPLRQQGITARLVAPQGGIVKGTSCVALVIDNASCQRLLATDAAGHLQLTVPRQGPRPDYPNSPMGATALLRQAFYDADWY